MTKGTRCALALAGLCLVTAPLRATVVADYRDDFETDGTPAAGWSYLWNPTHAVGSSANYVALVGDTNFGGDYETQANGSLPDAAPGSNLAATSTSLRPGQGSAQSALQIEHCAIAAYTISAQDIATAGGNQAWITSGFFTTGVGPDGVHAYVYVNDTLINGPTVLPAGVTFPDLVLPLGAVSAGDTIYVAIGSRFFDTDDVVTLDYSIELLPGGDLTLTGAASRRMHGATPFDLPVSLSTPSTVEPRASGPGSLLLLNFSGAIEAANGSFDCGDEVAIQGGQCQSLTPVGNVLVVEMSFDANTCVSATLSGIRGSGGGPALTGQNFVELTTHTGDVNGNGVVNILDLQAIKNMLLQPVDANNFLLDVNITGGSINILDLQATKNNLLSPIICEE